MSQALVDEIPESEAVLDKDHLMGKHRRRQHTETMGKEEAKYKSNNT